MNFASNPYQQGDTIAAIATPPGEGGVAIVRVSGGQAVAVAARVFSGPLAQYASHTLHLGKIIDANRNIIDEVLIAVMRAPRSYTGEDTVEIYCHGGSLITKRVLETILAAGARAARPGEFTFIAFMNGKLDLAQAEAVQAVIGAKSELALQAAKQQLQGALSQQIVQFQQELIDVAAILEAWVDFPEEDLEFASFEELTASIRLVMDKIRKLSATFDDGKILSEGLAVCLAGAPNVGKSSLMNALLGKDRAIVADLPGTTRDLLEADVRLAGLHLRLLDTAGIRDTREFVEQEGIRRTKEALTQADLIIFVLDAQRGVSIEEADLMTNCPAEKMVVVWNKIDIVSHQSMPPGAIAVSAKHSIGLDDLKHAIHQRIWRHGPPSKEEIVITSLRHKQALDQAAEALEEVIHGLKQQRSPEFCAADLRYALRELGTVIGGDITENVLDAVFAKFCVGK